MRPVTGGAGSTRQSRRNGRELLRLAGLAFMLPPSRRSQEMRRFLAQAMGDPTRGGAWPVRSAQ